MSLNFYYSKHKKYTMVQGCDTTNIKYIDFFKKLVVVVEKFIVLIGMVNNLIYMDKKDPGMIGDYISQYKAIDNYLSMAFLAVPKRIRYINLLEDIENDYTKGLDNLPPIITKA